MDRAPDRDLWWPLAGGALLVLSVLACLSLWGVPAHAAFPGTNGKIFCVGAADRTVDDDFELFSINPDGTGHQLITDNGPLRDPDVGTGFLTDLDPTLSPDGKKVAFASNRDGVLSIYLKNADGTGPETRLTEPASGFELLGGWSADGRKIYFNSTRDGNNEIYSVDVDGSNETNLTTRGSSDVAPSGSPDGSRILFHSDRDFTDPSGTFDIYSMKPDGTDVRPVIVNPGENDLYPNWSPDGKQIVFERVSAEPAPGFFVSNVFKANADGTGVTQVTFSQAGPVRFEGLNRFPVWSPDGTRISFDSERDNVVGQPRNRDVYTVNPDGSAVQRVTNAAGTDFNCDWQAIPRPAQPQPQPPPPPPPANSTPIAPAPAPVDERVRPNMIRPGFARAVQRGRRIVVRVRGKMIGNRGRRCGGRLKIGTRAGLRRAAVRSGRMGRNCRYAKRYSFPVRRLPPRLRPRKKTLVLRILIRYQGNSLLKGDLSPPKRVEARR